MVNFRKENSFGHVQSYPLPTPSMVRGMAHQILGLTEYNPLKISIQGNSDSVTVNMQKVMKFDRKRDKYQCPICFKTYIQSKSEASKCHNVNKENVIIIKDKRQKIEGLSNVFLNEVGGISFVDNLINCKLIIHITFENEELIKNLYEKVMKSTVVLGRNEDIARVNFDETKLTEISYSDDENELPYSIYVNSEDASKLQLSGTSFRLPFRYENVTSFSDSRIFHKVNCQYIPKNTILNEYTAETFLIDEDGLFVSFLET